MFEIVKELEMENKIKGKFLIMMNKKKKKKIETLNIIII